MLNILTVDVEEYFHPTEAQVSYERWSGLPSRIEAQTALVLDIFAEHKIAGTFFVLGWIARQNPELVRRIAEAGHEIGCHSYAHRLVYEMTPKEFAADLDMALKAIEDACGVIPRVYRAPSYSITERSLWALDLLVDRGFTHDSSIYPIHHDRYGIPGFNRNACFIETASGPIQEVPIATVRLSATRVAPVGGGGYLRLLPYSYTAAGIRRINIQERQPACVYFHPWEMDVDQPHIAPSALSRLRTYMGLRGMRRKIERLLTEFPFATMTSVHPGIESPHSRFTYNGHSRVPLRTMSTAASKVQS